MNRQRLYEIRSKWLHNNWIYECSYYKDFDYTILSEILYIKRRGRGHNDSANDCIIMFDTETSKKRENPIALNEDGTTKYVTVMNHIVAWTISIRAFHQNICTLYGTRPSELVECINSIMEHMEGQHTNIYAHNLAYDWVFCRKFFINAWGKPRNQLNTKPHYPIMIEFNNGLTLKDSLILAQRSLDRWSKDMNVEHQKASGKWDYDMIRHQQNGKPSFTQDELEYIEHDTLAGVECIDATMTELKKDVWSLPYTATGIPRGEIRKRAEEYNYHDAFLRQALDLNQYRLATQCYHGGYTHANRHLIETIIKYGEADAVESFNTLIVHDRPRARDFSSSYPFSLLAEKYPAERFDEYCNKSVEQMLELTETYAAMFKLVLIDFKLKSDDIVMPSLQFSKCVKTLDITLDNGRALAGSYAEIYMTNIDLLTIAEQYDWKYAICTEVQLSRWGYLPRFITDYIYSLYESKTMLKGTNDAVAYSLRKSALNSIYGMFCEKSLRDDIQEDYDTGEYVTTTPDAEDAYNKYINKRNSVLNYQVGVFCTAWAQRHLFEFAKCCGTFIYSDTDSIYGYDWNEELVDQYNEACKEKLRANGYGPVIHNGREYWLGIAETEDTDLYDEFRVMGAKRYCGRHTCDGELVITVAGVPKKNGKKCLKDNIENFTAGFVFDGKTTGKMMHTYVYVDDILIDTYGNETGDSIDLTYCDYLLDSVDVVRWDDIETKEIQIQLYEEDITRI